LASPPLEPASPAAWSENSALLPSATQQAAEANQAAWPEDQSNTPLPWADDSANQPLHWSDSPGSDYLEQPADDWSAQAAAPANTGLTDTGSIRVWAASVDSFAAEQPANWTEPAQPASAPIVEPSSDSQLFDTFADNPDLTGQSFDQPAPADWQAPAIANNFDSDWSQLGPAVVADDQAESGFDQTNAAQNWDAEPLWDPPPEILQDGTGPWLAGPDAQQEVPRRRVGRLIVSLVLILLLAVAIGFAVWFVINQTRPAADAATLFNLPQTVTSVGFQVVR
jgi:hypothetical protein